MKKENRFALTSDGRAPSLKSVVYWLCGIAFCDLGIALCTKAGFGLSMIGAGPYILHVFVSRYLPCSY